MIGGCIACQICGAKSGYYPLCNDCFKLRDLGKVTKCKKCGIWKKGNKPLCSECFIKKIESEEVFKSEIGYEDKKFRDKYKAVIRAEDGHYVRSKSEKIIDDWLYHKLIIHVYERKVPIKEEVFCDFYIPIGNIWIEFWGLNDDKYKKRKNLKKDIYKKYDMNLLELTERDIENLDDILPVKLRKFIPNQNFI